MKPEQWLPVLIREAEPEDAARIVQLVCQAGADSEISETYVLHYLSGTDRCILLAEREDLIVGLLSYSVRADLYHAGNSMLIEELVVEETCRGEGIGAELMKALFDRAKGLGCKELCLAVMPDNEGAIRFYKRHGLVEQALFLERHFP